MTAQIKKEKSFTRDSYEKHILLMLSNQLISCSVFSELTSKVHIRKLFDRMEDARFMYLAYQDVLQSEYIAPH